ncbi:MAG TPA: MgtC/SapB family protein [Candidatus Dormibacteraeota bacterium]
MALVLGLALGAERETQGHPAGLRTMGLISVGACVFTAVGLEPIFGIRTDPTRIAAQIVTGVGFIGAGAILRQGGEIIGLTTAASIWVAAALGMAAGFGFYAIAVFTTFLVIVTLVALRPIERRFFHHHHRRRDDPPPPEAER